MAKALCLFTAVSLVVSCARAPESSSNARPATDTAIYRVLLDSLWPNFQSVVVRREFLEARGPVDQPTDLAAWVGTQPGGIDSALVMDLLTARYSGAVSDFVQSANGLRWEDFPRTSDSLAKHSSAVRDSPDSSRISTERFSDPEMTSAQRHLAFSRIVYSHDSSRALVYASMWCGGLCGNESFYLLGRDRHGSWRVVATVVRFIS